MSDDREQAFGFKVEFHFGYVPADVVIRLKWISRVASIRAIG
jgi:hypothetical protein